MHSLAGLVPKQRGPGVGRSGGGGSRRRGGGGGTISTLGTRASAHRPSSDRSMRQTDDHHQDYHHRTLSRRPPSLVSRLPLGPPTPPSLRRARAGLAAATSSSSPSPSGTAQLSLVVVAGLVDQATQRAVVRALDAAARARTPLPLRAAFLHEEEEEEDKGDDDGGSGGSSSSSGRHNTSLEERVAALAAAGDRELCVVVARPTSSPLPLAAALSFDEEDDDDDDGEDDDDDEAPLPLPADGGARLDAVVTLVDAARLVAWLEQEDARTAAAAAVGAEGLDDEDEDDDDEDPTLAQLGLLDVTPLRQGGSTDGDDDEFEESADDDRTLPELLADQAEAADVLVLTSSGPTAAAAAASSSSSPSSLARAEELLRRLNPDAALVTAVSPQADLRDGLSPKIGEAVLAAAAGAAAAKQARRRALFAPLAAAERERQRQRALFAVGGGGGGEDDDDDHDHLAAGAGAGASPGWLERALAGADDDRADTPPPSHGVWRWAYRAERPFSAQRLLEGPLSRRWPGVLRSRGLFWLAPRDEVAGVWQSSGGAWRGDPADLWPPRPQAGGNASALLSPRAPATSVRGERRTRLEFLCAAGDARAAEACRARLVASLDACLLTDAEMALGPGGWTGAGGGGGGGGERGGEQGGGGGGGGGLPDPLPPWWE